MSPLKRVDLWPASGWPSLLWQPSLDNDMFARTAARVTHLYGDGLAQSTLPAVRKQPTLMLLTESSGPPGADVIVRTFASSGEIGGNIRLPEGISNLASSERARLVLDVIDTSMRSIFFGRRWSAEGLDLARRHVIDKDFTWLWRSPVTMNRSGRFAAQAHYQLLDDGFGSVQLELRDLEDNVLSRTAPQLAYCTQAGFVRSAKTVRWVDDNSAEFIPYVGAMGSRGLEVVLSVDDDPSGICDRSPLWPRGRSPHAGIDEGLPSFDEPSPDAFARRPRVRVEAS